MGFGLRGITSLPEMPLLPGTIIARQAQRPPSPIAFAPQMARIHGLWVQLFGTRLY